MESNRIKTGRLIVGTIILLLLVSTGLRAQSTAFTYQGKLNDNGLAANGNFDLEFRLFDGAAGGGQVGAAVSLPNVQVANGVFTVQLDFGAVFDGAGRYLEIALKPAGSPNAFTVLAPRQPVTSTPYAIRSLDAANAANAQTAANAQSLGGVAANQYVVTTDARMTDARAPLAGSPDYIQNTTTAQANSNFNVSGNGTVGGTLSANVVNAEQRYNYFGVPFLVLDENNNFFAGTGAGANNTTGSFNSYFGISAGSHNTTGTFNSYFGNTAGFRTQDGAGNSFFGYQTGFSNVSGAQNSFFGTLAGKNSTAANNSFFGYQSGYLTVNGGDNSFFGYQSGRNNTDGTGNVFIGATAGSTNTTGSNNTIVGKGANVSSANLSFATALGAGAAVGSSNTVVLGRAADTVQIPGVLNVQGNLFGSGANLTGLNAGSITGGVLPTPYGGTGLTSSGPLGNFLRSNGANWSSSPIQVADLPDLSAKYIQNSVNQQAGSFNVAGSGTVGGTLSGGVVNAATQYTIGGAAAFKADSLSSTTVVGLDSGTALAGGLKNTFVGRFAGSATTSGSENTFTGAGAGQNNLDGAGNSYYGNLAGSQNQSGTGNSFFGNQTGGSGGTGSNNSFFGTSAGYNSAGSGNSFFGASAGYNNTNGSGNSFFGSNAGIGTTTGANNSFFGVNAGAANTTGSNNIFIGQSSGGFNAAGSNNIFIGRQTGLLASVEDNNTLIGNNVQMFFGVTNSTAIGNNATVDVSHQIVLGTNQETVRIPGISGLGTQALCADANNVIRLCAGGAAGGGRNESLSTALAEKVREQQAEIEKRKTEAVRQTELIETQQKRLDEQQKQLDELKKLVCAANPQAALCQEVK
ncbi:MAG: hypothetical protein JSS81_23010 [Acidobacteria bacterium]|nr:hypothetical protein [Acidobacteriota bacterium]